MEKYLLRGAHNPIEVILLIQEQGLKRVTFAERVDPRETMQKIGVMDKPDVCFPNSWGHNFHQLRKICWAGCLLLFISPTGTEVPANQIVCSLP